VPGRGRRNVGNSYDISATLADRDGLSLDAGWFLIIIFLKEVQDLELTLHWGQVVIGLGTFFLFTFILSISTALDIFASSGTSK
jgi:hypothetical protein